MAECRYLNKGGNELRSNTAPKTISVALSGGGTRAALYSSGAMLAITEAWLDGSVEVRSIRSVSGSSLLLARLILASDDVQRDATDEARLSLFRDEIDDVIKYGFATGFRRILVWLIAMDVTAGGVVWWLGRQIGGGPAPSLGLWLLMVLVGSSIVVWWMLRSERIILRRAHRSRRKRFLNTSGRQWFSVDHDMNTRLLPTADIAFLSTCLSTGRIESLSPWGQHPPGDQDLDRISLATLAAASAAFPVYSAAVAIGDRMYGDGGALDNLGVTGFAQNDGTALEVMVVDAAKTNPVGSIPRYQWMRGPVRLFVFAEASLFVGGVAKRIFPVLQQNARYKYLLLLFMLLAWLYAIGALSARAAFLAWRTLRVETSITSAMQAHCNQANLQHLVQRGHRLNQIQLVSAASFRSVELRQTHDLKTRLSPVRRDTAVELVRSSYLQTVQQLGTTPSPQTVDWLSSIDPPKPSPFRRRCRAAWSRVFNASAVCVLGRDMADE